MCTTYCKYKEVHFATQCTCVFRTILTTNSGRYPKRLVFIRAIGCSLRVTNLRDVTKMTVLMVKYPMWIVNTLKNCTYASKNPRDIKADIS